LVKLPSSVSVQFGDAKKISVTQSVVLKSALNERDLELLIIPLLSVPVLIGQGDIKSHGLLKTVNSYPAETNTPESVQCTVDNPSPQLQFSRNDKGKIEVTCPMFEDASILPWREKQRPHSEVEQKIMDVLIEDMLSKGQLRKVSPEEVVIIQDILLVDKFAAKGITSPKVFPPEDGRYRLVLDSRPANALRFDKASNSWIVDSLLFGPKKQSDTNEVKQSQRSSLFQIESIPRKFRKFYGKIDLKNAFYSTYTTKKLSRLFGFKQRPIPSFYGDTHGLVSVSPNIPGRSFLHYQPF